MKITLATEKSHKKSIIEAFKSAGYKESNSYDSAFLAFRKEKLAIKIYKDYNGFIMKPYSNCLAYNNNNKIDIDFDKISELNEENIKKAKARKETANVRAFSMPLERLKLLSLIIDDYKVCDSKHVIVSDNLNGRITLKDFAINFYVSNREYELEKVRHNISILNNKSELNITLKYHSIIQMLNNINSIKEYANNVILEYTKYEKELNANREEMEKAFEDVRKTYDRKVNVSTKLYKENIDKLKKELYK